MRLTTSPTCFRSLLAILFLGAFLILPAMALAQETPSVQAESSGEGPLAGQPQPVYPSGTPKSQTDSSAPTTNATPESGEADSESAETQAEPVDQPPASKVLVSIDKGSQEMTVFVDGIELHTWPVSTGLYGYSTPSGSYNATSMNKMWYSRQWDNAPMPHAIFFTKKGHAIHGTHETKKLGSPASKGCVRLSPKHAEALFTLVKEKGMENTEIVLAGLTPGGEAKIAAPSQRAYPPGHYAPWFERPQAYDRPRRRGLFGNNRRWRDNAQRGPRYYQPRGVAPWNY
ncbi:MAG: L,D-transpeptidase [Alphaproteobacteria bacterium]|nr:L,D-transpeptidase [Alphaproteobacteria bacterium]